MELALLIPLYVCLLFLEKNATIKLLYGGGRCRLSRPRPHIEPIWFWLYQRLLDTHDPPKELLEAYAAKQNLK